MLSADAEAWRVREGMNLFTDSRSEAAKWNIPTWKRTLVWRQGSEPGTSPVPNVPYILQSSEVHLYIILALAEEEMEHQRGYATFARPQSKRQRQNSGPSPCQSPAQALNFGIRGE